MNKNILKYALTAGLLISAGCAASSGQMGGVNKNVRDYAAMATAQNEKIVEYFCNFDKVARQDFSQFGDYCQKAPNQDYVSYFIPPDIQSTTGYREHMAQTVKWMLSGGDNSPVKYYQIYTDNDYARLKKLDIPNIAPTSFAVMVDEKSYAVAVTKNDLLARVYVTPELGIRSLVPDGSGDVITDYRATFQITPYAFKVQYSDDEVARYLGLPAYKQLTGSLDPVRKMELKRYNDTLEAYWKRPILVENDPKKTDAADYVFPALGTDKFKSGDTSSILTLGVTPPYEYEGLANEYLPAYRLQKVEILSADKDGVPTVLKSFDADDILRTVLSFDENAALFHKGSMTDGMIFVRYTHVADAPKKENLKDHLNEKLGIGYIYSDMAAVIHTDLYINRYYPVKNTPRACVDGTKFVAEAAKKGISQEEAEKYLAGLYQAKVAECTPNQLSIIKMLPDILGE